MLSTETHGEAPGCRSSKVDCVGIPGERCLGLPAVFHGEKNHGIWDFTINYSNHKWDLLGLKADFRFDMDLTMIYRGFYWVLSMIPFE